MENYDNTKKIRTISADTRDVADISLLSIDVYYGLKISYISVEHFRRF